MQEQQSDFEMRNENEVEKPCRDLQRMPEHSSRREAALKAELSHLYYTDLSATILKDDSQHELLSRTACPLPSYSLEPWEGCTSLAVSIPEEKWINFC